MLSCQVFSIFFVSQLILLNVCVCVCVQHDITDMKRKMKSMSQEIGQLNEEIKSKEAALVKEHLEFQKLQKEKEALKAQYYSKSFLLLPNYKKKSLPCPVILFYLLLLQH